MRAEKGRSMYLEDHPNTDEDHDPLGVVHVPQPAQPGVPAAIAAMRPSSPVRVRISLLQVGYMQEPHVGGLEQGDAQREVDTHEEVLDIIRQHDVHGASDRVRDLGKHPVAVQEENGSQREGQSADAQDGRVAVEPAEGCAGEDEGRPCRAEADVEDTHAIPPGWCRREVVDGEVLHLEDSGGANSEQASDNIVLAEGSTLRRN